MVESVFAKIIGKSTKFQTDKNYTLTEILIVALVCVMLACYLRYLWGRRKMYFYSYHIPGPFALPFIGSALSLLGKPNDIYGNVTYMFNTYPGLFRVWFGSKLFYCVADPKYFEILLTHPQLLNKEYLYRMVDFASGEGLFTAPVLKWRKHRKILLPTFNPKILEKFVQVFASQSEQFTDELKKFSCNGEFDVLHAVSNCTMDILSETAMGVRRNNEKEFPKWIDRIIAICFMRIFNIQYHNDTIFHMLPIGKEQRQLSKKIKDVVNKIVEEKRIAYQEKLKRIADNDYVKEDEPKWKPFLDLLIELTSQEGSKFTDDELREEVTTFLIAGTDTSASSNCFVLTMLGMHQDVQQKVYEEAIDVLGPDRSIEPDDLPKFKYLERVIKETLRLFPVGFIVAREAQEDIKLDDFTIAAGCSVVFGILRVHRNEKYWPNPLKFDPARFLPQECAKRHPCTFVPFSYGPRNCIGMRYAMMAMKTFLATLIRKYRIYTSYKTVEEIQLQANMFLRPVHGFKVSIENR